MNIALAIPAYRQTVNVQTAYAWAHDAMTALDLGWKPVLLWIDASGIARARNVIVQQAERADCRLLLMCDSDSFPDAPDGGLRRMWETMQKTQAAVVGAAFVTRNGDRVNCEPVNPGETYEGEVGTAYMLIDLWKLRALPKPWFVHADTADGLHVECGEDIYFCRAAHAAGHRVVVNYALPTGHMDLKASRTFE